MYRMPWGKYKGKTLNQLPVNYLCWYRDHGPRAQLRIVLLNEYYRRMYQN